MPSQIFPFFVYRPTLMGSEPLFVAVNPSLPRTTTAHMRLHTATCERLDRWTNVVHSSNTPVLKLTHRIECRTKEEE